MKIRALAAAALLAWTGSACGSPSAAPGAQPGAAAAEPSVHPGINATYVDPELDVAAFEARFETESREVFAQRAELARALELRPGSSVADVGAGTGIYTELFAEAVGPAGIVFAVELAPRFVEHLAQRARAAPWPNVQVVQCTERSVELPPGAIDAAFVCDTYHHFEYPRATLASLHRALRPGGRLFVVDFERIPGVSSDWILEHVRAGRETVVAEIEEAGFELVRALPVDLAENYALEFQRR